MLIALVLIVLGVILFASVPILGWILGLLLILAGLAIGILALLGRGIGAIAGIGSTKVCPDCRTKIPADAKVCRQCGYRYPT